MQLPVAFSMRQTVVSVAATSTTIVAANPTRKYLGVMNLGTVPVTLSFDGTPAVVGAGWILAAAPSAGTPGTTLMFDKTGVPIQALNGIATTGTANIAVLEGY